MRAQASASCRPWSGRTDGEAVTRAPMASGHAGPADGVLVGTEPDLAALRDEDHVADRASPAGNGGAGEEALFLRVEAEEAVGLRTGLHQPDAIPVVHGHGVGQRLLAGRS